jgi:hypothetical protein
MNSKLMPGRRSGAPDDRTLDRVLSGTAAPEDVSPDMRAVTQLLGAVASPRDEALPGTGSVGGAPQDSPPDHQIIAAMTSIIVASEVRGGTRAEARSWGRSTRVRSPLARFSRAAAAVALALFLMTGMAFAGILPGPMQDVARTALSTIGVTVPGGDEQGRGDGQQVPDEEGTEGGGEHESAGRAGDRGPDPAGPAHQGLCNAYRNGNGGEQGGKNGSTAFANLQDAAAAAGQTVDEYCGGTGNGPTEGGQGDDPSHGKGNGHQKDGDKPGNGNGHQKDGDKPGNGNDVAEDHGEHRGGDRGGKGRNPAENVHGSGHSGSGSNGHGRGSDPGNGS